MSDKFGAFGKIPGMGDFLRLNVSARFVQAWDSWLQSTILAARGTLGDAWDPLYLSAPIWRFTLPSGQAGGQAMSGILMASVDRVGRQFPLTLVAPHGHGNLALIHFANRATFEQLEEIALTTLEDELPRDGLAAALDTPELILPAPAATSGVTYADALPPETTLAADALTQAHGDVGIWTAALPDDHRMMLRKQLPDAADMLGLIDLDASMWTSGISGAVA